MNSKGKGSILSNLMDRLKIKEIEKPSYQIYDKLVFEEVEDAKNFDLPKIQENCLYETKRIKKHGSKRIYLVKSKDVSAADKVNIPFITSKDLYDELRKNHGYYHIAAIQILVRYLGNAGLDIPIRLIVRDERQMDTQKSIMGLWSSNLYTGAVYTMMELDYCLSATDRNIDSALRLSVIADNNVMEGSKNLAVSIKTYLQWHDAVQPFRKPLENGEGKVAPGSAIVIKSSSMDVTTIPQPIPIDALTYNLEFDFPKRDRKIKVGESSNTDYVIQGNNSLKIRLKEPEHLALGRSKRFNQARFEEYLDNPIEEDE
ncbi:movement protein [Viola yellow mottle virus]|uniref:Movement protein n=1 Tax=Viola yellow mottle virus TaxID=2922803 RepID=A0A976MFZ8_9VIRU|nr:movement protein [Viola yellow mottle virus]